MSTSIVTIGGSAPNYWTQVIKYTNNNVVTEITSTYKYIHPGHGMTYILPKSPEVIDNPKLENLRRLYALTKIRKDKQQLTYLEKAINAQSKSR